MAIIDVVRFDGLKSRDWLIYKYYSDNLVTGSQLIVQAGGYLCKGRHDLRCVFSRYI